MRLRFVIQRHAARRLHYDFRLERDGALASWAVPKGVPLRKGERHLAVHVEDHPLEYADFEGVIPAGEYGAGTVEIWDRGTYDLLEEKRNGGLTVRLRGERLDGVWTLVPASLDGDEKNWLLLRKDAGDGSGGRYEPMRAVAADAPPVGEGWVFEPKWDGYRAIVTVSGGEVTLTSRNGNDLTERFREVARAATLAITTPDAVLDGEICALDEQGRSRFSLLQEGGGTPVLVLFDLLELESESLVDLPLSERRKRLEQIVDSTRRRARVAAVRRRSGSPGRGSPAGPRGRRRQEGGLAVQAGPPIARVAQGQAAADAGGRHRGVHPRPGPALGRVRRSRRGGTRRGCAAVGRKHRDGLLGARDRAAVGRAQAARASRLAVRGGSQDAARAPVATSRGSSRVSSPRSSSPSGRTRAGCAPPRTCAFARTGRHPTCAVSAHRSRPS